jgi:hypothetical protein
VEQANWRPVMAALAHPSLCHAPGVAAAPSSEVLLLHRLLLLRQQLNKVWWHGSNLLQQVCCHLNTLLCFSFDFSFNFELLPNFNIFQHDFSIVLWRWLQLLLRSKGPVQRDSAFLVTHYTFQDPVK